MRRTSGGGQFFLEGKMYHGLFKGGENLEEGLSHKLNWKPLGGPCVRLSHAEAEVFGCSSKHSKRFLLGAMGLSGECRAQVVFVLEGILLRYFERSPVKLVSSRLQKRCDSFDQWCQQCYGLFRPWLVDEWRGHLQV